ncbi:MAG: hypothetical protein EPN49_00670 [Rhodanobacter sp.]|nr:MAG: hypothetical protein EPN49_00670 [Rhodanobacter sp.]
MGWTCESRQETRCEGRPKRPRWSTRDAQDRGRSARRLFGLVLSLATALSGAPACAANSYDSAAGSAPLRWSFSLDSEVVDNLGGGIAPGSMGDHLARLNSRLDGAALGLPDGSRFHATFARTQSGLPSATRVGDSQSVSNIEAEARSRVYEFWYGQYVGKPWDVRAGLIAADAHFDTVDSASLLLNSSFGVQPTWSGNTVAPIFPTAGVGIMATWRVGAWTNRAGIFQADPADRASALRRGALLMDEVAYQGEGVYKLGVWSYRPHGPEETVLSPPTWGTYFSADYPLGRGDGAPSAFLRAGWSPKVASAVGHDLQAGILVPGPLRWRPRDQFSLGIARADLRGLGVETAYEITYLVALSPHVSLQPDLQYVNKPGGNLPSAVVANLRLHLEFD